MQKNTFEVSGHEVVAVLTLSRPYCLDIEGKHALLDALALLADRPNLRALIINASDPLAWLVNVAEPVEMTPTDARSFSHAGHRLAPKESRGRLRKHRC